MFDGMPLVCTPPTNFGDPALLLDPIEDFPEVNFVLAHGGRGWSDDPAA